MVSMRFYSGGATVHRAAGALLLAMGALFLLARTMADRHPVWGFVQAFAEAGMVGGLADWFAVTAMFRHPLGLPIPHTAIIPRNKDRIGDALAAFLRDNFLTPRVVARRMGRWDVAGTLARFLAQPSGLGERLRLGASRLAADMLESLDRERLGGMMKAAVVQRIAKLDLAPMIGQALEAAMRDGRHAPLLDAMIRWTARALDEQADMIRALVHEKSGSILRFTGLDERLANAIIDGLRKLLVEMEGDAAHPVRLRAQEALENFTRRLQHDADMHAKVARIRDEIVANPALQSWIDGLWEQARAALLRAARDPQAALAGRLGELLRQMGTTLGEDAALRSVINRFARRAIVGITDSYGDAIVRLVSETVRGWDAQTVTERLEATVGRDLQYIRINGTLVGGLVGLAIHTVDVAM